MKKIFILISLLFIGCAALNIKDYREDEKRHIIKTETLYDDAIIIESREYYIKNRERCQAYGRNYYHQHKERVKEYRLKNREKMLAYLKKYALENRERKKEYRLKNRERDRQWHKEYYQRNKQRLKEKRYKKEFPNYEQA